MDKPRWVIISNLVVVILLKLVMFCIINNDVEMNNPSSPKPILEYKTVLKVLKYNKQF